MLNRFDSEFESYSYDSAESHLSEQEALQKYRQAVRMPGNLVVLIDYDCGHWGVSEYKTPEEKEVFLRKTLQEYLNRVLKYFAAR